jgi:hypothetical protein
MNLSTRKSIVVRIRCIKNKELQPWLLLKY